MLSREMQLLHGCLLIAGLLVSKPVLAGTHSLKVTIVGLRNNHGKVYVSIYNSAVGYPTDPNKALRKGPVAIVNGIATASFGDFPDGVYAVACFHDENSNGMLDKNFIGIPTEGTGASRDAKGFLGPPKFNDADFTLQSDGAITIHMQY